MNKPICDFYQVVYAGDGYTVFRWYGDPPTGYTFEQTARIHRVATFVTETEARDYCDYRNRLMDIFGDDKVPRKYELLNSNDIFSLVLHKK